MAYEKNDDRLETCMTTDFNPISNYISCLLDMHVRIV